MALNLILSLGFSSFCTGLFIFVLLPAWQDWGNSNGVKK
jgi:hypothetical protein